MGTAAVVSVGDELLAGDIADANAGWIARRLRQEGIRLAGVWVVGDRVADIARALRAAADQADVVLVTGGLGPTADDLTREGLAAALGTSLQEHAVARASVLDFYARLGRSPSPSNLRQAQVPQGAEPFANPVGTAPGIHARLGRAGVFLLPGVPKEMRHLMQTEVVERLRRMGCCGPAPHRVRVRIHGLPESDAGERIVEWMGEGRDPLVGITADEGILDVAITGSDCAMVERAARDIEARLGDAVFGRDQATLEQVVVAELGRRGWRMACAESCTGGLVARLIVRVPGASAVLEEGVVAYADAAKQRRLGVSADTLRRYGAVSSEVAREMAAGVAAASGVDAAVAVTGIAGPAGGSADKPVGLVHFAVWVRGALDVNARVFPGDREQVQRRAAQHALDLVRRALRAAPEEGPPTAALRDAGPCGS